MRKILYQFIDMTKRGATMSLTLNEPKEVALHSNSNTTPEDTPSQMESKLLILHANNQS
jgi:hypothetical protein